MEPISQGHAKSDIPQYENLMPFVDSFSYPLKGEGLKYTT